MPPEIQAPLCRSGLDHLRRQHPGKFDFILINSFLHHLNDADSKKVLSCVAARFSEGGQLHILELVSPQDHSIAQCWPTGIAESIRVRSKNGGRCFEEHLDVTLFEPYPLRLLGLLCGTWSTARQGQRHEV